MTLLRLILDPFSPHMAMWHLVILTSTPLPCDVTFFILQKSMGFCSGIPSKMFLKHFGWPHHVSFDDTVANPQNVTYYLNGPLRTTIAAIIIITTIIFGHLIHPSTSPGLIITGKKLICNNAMKMTYQM